jgi:hypothetical protein
MGFFNIMREVVKAKIGDDHHVPTVTPLELTQGALVKFDGPDIALAQANGSIVPNIDGEQTVIAVGKQKLFGLDVYHSYLSDNKSFIQTVIAKDKTVECKLFVLRDEVAPQNVQEWEFWMSTYKRGKDGEIMVDPKTGEELVEEYGLIGWPEFQIDGPPPIKYSRSWMPGAEGGVIPVNYHEHVSNGQSSATVDIEHESMEYTRTLGKGASATTEYVFVTASSHGNGESGIDIFVGIALNAKDLNILHGK